METVKIRIAGIVFIAGLIALSACSSASQSSSAPQSGQSGQSGSSSSSTPTKLVFNADGTPNLKGLSFSIGNAAGSAHTGDTNVYDLVQFLKKWGANASQTNASQNAPELAVASGQLNAAAGPLPTEVDSGLSVFGPNQARLDDVVLAKNSVASLAGLKGANVAICCDASPDGVLLAAVLKKAGLSESQMNILRTGASSASLSAMIAGRVDVAFVHSSDVPTAGPGYHVLAVGATILPQYADSFMAATPSWLKANPAMAEAIDLAWLASAKLFNSDETTWVANAASYTSNADPTAKYQQSWHELQSIQGWPANGSILTPSIVTFNVNIAAQQQALKGEGTRPAAQEMDLTPWQQAWAQFSAHESAY
jgi:ABC-type nitrate/sulfonate/bicarbonate transport system substrate-binding protein